MIKEALSPLATAVAEIEKEVDRLFPEADKTAVEDFVSTVDEAHSRLDLLHDGIVRADFDGFEIGHIQAQATMKTLEEIIRHAEHARLFLQDGEYDVPPGHEELARLGVTETDPKLIIEALIRKLDEAADHCAAVARGDMPF